MSKVSIAVTSTVGAIMAAGIVSAADAQPGRYYEQPRFEQRARPQLTTAYVDGLQWRIQQAAREGRISWNQARDLQRDLTRVQPIAYRYQTGQAQGWEIDQLQRTVYRIDAATGRRF